MAKATFPASSQTVAESTKPAAGDGFTATDHQNAYSALFQGDLSPLRPRANAPATLKVNVAKAEVEGFFRQIYGNSAHVTFAGGDSPTFTAPATNPRIDLLYLDVSSSPTGALPRLAGSEAASPSEPALPTPLDKNIPICYVYNRVGQTTIVNFEDAGANPTQGYIYRDVRPWIGGGGGGNATAKYLLGDTTLPSDLTAALLSMNQGFANLLKNGSFESWSGGANAVPDGWTLLGAGASAQRDGPGGGDVLHGNYSLLLQRNGTNCAVQFDVNAALNAILSGLGTYYQGRTFTFSAWCKATVASRARIYINDGVASYYSSYHTGNGTWQLLSVTQKLSASASAFNVNVSIDTGDTTVFYDGAVLCEGSAPIAFGVNPNDEQLRISNYQDTTPTNHTDQGVWRAEIGEANISFSGVTSASVTVTFQTAFRTIRVGFGNDENALQTTIGVKAASLTASSMQVLAFDTTNTARTGTARVSWIAIGQV